MVLLRLDLKREAATFRPQDVTGSSNISGTLLASSVDVINIPQRLQIVTQALVTSWLDNCNALYMELPLKATQMVSRKLWKPYSGLMLLMFFYLFCGPCFVLLILLSMSGAKGSGPYVKLQVKRFIPQVYAQQTSQLNSVLNRHQRKDNGIQEGLDLLFVYCIMTHLTPSLSSAWPPTVYEIILVWAICMIYVYMFSLVLYIAQSPLELGNQ